LLVWLQPLQLRRGAAGASSGEPERSIRVSRSKRSEGLEAALRRADATLEDWFRTSRVTTRQASIVFARFLGRATKRGAGALRRQVDDLQVGLKKLSTGLQEVERTGPVASPKAAASRKPARSRKPVAASKPAASRKRKKAA
jgi:hypothetical protein